MITSIRGQVLDRGRLVLSNVEFFINKNANPWIGMFEYPHGYIDVGQWTLDLDGFGKVEVTVEKCIIDPEGIPVAYFKRVSKLPQV